MLCVQPHIRQVNMLRFICSGLFVILFTFAGFAQPFIPKVRYQHKANTKGFYFLYPYLMHNDKNAKLNAMMILDGSANVVFYKTSPHASDFKLHHNGLISYFASGKFYLMDKTFGVIDSVYCQNGIETDSHDFIILPNGHYLLLGKESITENWSRKRVFTKQSVAAMPERNVKYGVVQELDEHKCVVFQWSAKNSHKPEDADAFYLRDARDIDLTHFNSVDMDEDGNIIVSARYFNEVLKIKRSDSSLVWRMGGKRNQVRIMNDSLPFYGQHDARFIGKNRFTVFDNGYSFDSLKHNVRVIEYVVNDSLKTALVASKYSNENRIICEATGNAQLLENGNLLVSYGKIEGYQPNITFEMISKKENTKLLQVYFDDTIGTYRTYYYEKLPFKLMRPAIRYEVSGGRKVLSTSRKFSYYAWSTGAQTAEIIPENPGDYFVYVSDDGKSYYRSKIIRIKRLKRAATS